MSILRRLFITAIALLLTLVFPANAGSGKRSIYGHDCIMAGDFSNKDTQEIVVRTVNDLCYQKCHNECKRVFLPQDAHLNSDIYSRCLISCKKGEIFSSGIREKNHKGQTTWRKQSDGRIKKFSTTSYCNNSGKDRAQNNYQITNFKPCYRKGNSVKCSGKYNIQIITPPGFTNNEVFMCGNQSIKLIPSYKSMDPQGWNDNKSLWDVRDESTETWNARNPNFTDTGINVKDGGFLKITYKGQYRYDADVEPEKGYHVYYYEKAYIPGYKYFEYQQGKCQNSSGKIIDCDKNQFQYRSFQRTIKSKKNNLKPEELPKPIISRTRICLAYERCDYIGIGNKGFCTNTKISEPYISTDKLPIRGLARPYKHTITWDTCNKNNFYEYIDGSNRLLEKTCNLPYTNLKTKWISQSSARIKKSYYRESGRGEDSHRILIRKPGQNADWDFADAIPMPFSGQHLIWTEKFPDNKPRISYSAAKKSNSIVSWYGLKGDTFIDNAIVENAFPNRIDNSDYYTNSDMSIIVSDHDVIHNFSGTLEGFTDGKWARLGMKHFDKTKTSAIFEQGNSWGENLGGYEVDIEWKGCPYFDGERLQYTIIANNNAQNAQWKDITAKMLQGTDFLEIDESLIAGYQDNDISGKKN